MRLMVGWMAVVVIGLGATAPAAEKTAAPAGVKADLSSPKAAVKTYLEAMSAGDAATAKAAVVASAAQAKAIDAACAMIQSWNRLGEAAKKQFKIEGDAAEALNAMQVGQKQKLEYMRKQAEEADVQEQGDRATVRFKAGSDSSQATTLRREGGGWKVEMDSLPTGRNAEEMAGLMGAMAKAADETARAIEGGQYKDINEAKAAFAERNTEAVRPFVKKAATTQPGR